MGALPTTQATDQGDEGVEMTFTMASEMREELHEALFYGTIAAVRVTHGAPPDWKVVRTESIPELTRIVH